jgi:hypothetical protein
VIDLPRWFLRNFVVGLSALLVLGVWWAVGWLYRWLAS